MNDYQKTQNINIKDENIWLQRNNHYGEKAWEVLGFDKKGDFICTKKHFYISIGCNSNKLTQCDFETLLSFNDVKQRWNEFEKICKNKIYNCSKLPRYRYSLWRFLFDYKKGDYILVPSNQQDFHIFRICSNKVLTYNSINKTFNLPNKNENDDFLYFWEVEPIRVKMKRKYLANQSLTSRMKIRSTLCCINDLKDDITTALKTEKRLSVHSNAINDTAELLIKSIQSDLDDIKFEKLIKWYFNKTNASYTKILPKNVKGEQDADVLAVYDNLKLKIYVQAKKHDKNVNIDEAYKQISEYKKLQEIDEYTYLYWIICSATEIGSDKYDTDDIRIIYGTEFAEMLLDVGLSGIDNALYE